MDKVIELAKQAGIPFNKYDLIGCDSCERDIDEALQAFYALARADLEAELLEQARIIGMGAERELKLMAENAKLRHALVKAEAALVRVEHLIGGGDDEVSIESEILTVRAALEE